MRLQKTSILFFLIYFFSATYVFSQQIDSLFSEYSKYSKKNDNISLCNTLSELLYKDGHLEKQYYFSKNTPEDSIKITIHFGVAEYYFSISKYAESINNAELSLKISIENNDTLYTTLNYNLLSCCYQRIGNFDKALETAQKSLFLARLSNDAENESSTLNNIGTIYMYLKQPKKSIIYLNDALKIDRLLKREDKIAIRLSNLAEAHLMLKEPKEALSLITEAINIDKKAGRQNKVGIRLSVLGNIYNELSDYKNAEKAYKESIQIFEETKNMPSMAISLYQLGMLKLNNNENNEAINYLDRCKTVSDSFNLTYMQAKALHGKYKTYKNIGNNNLALSNLEEYLIVNDSIFKMEMQKQVANFEVQYELQKKVAQIAINEKMLKRSQYITQILLVTSISIVIICILLYLFARNKQKYSKKLEEINNSKDKLFSILSHDLKGPSIAQKMIIENTINNIDNLKDTELKKIFTSLRDASEAQLSLIQNLKEWANLQIRETKSTPVIFELNTIIKDIISLYEISAKQKNIDINLEIPDNCIVYADKQQISTVLRNLINNAIKFSHEGIPIFINVKEKNSTIFVSIKDNGIGLNEEQIKSIFNFGKPIQRDGTKGEKGSGLGLLICIDILKKNKSNLKIESQENKGTEMSFELQKP